MLAIFSPAVPVASNTARVHPFQGLLDAAATGSRTTLRRTRARAGALTALGFRSAGLKSQARRRIHQKQNAQRAIAAPMQSDISYHWNAQYRLAGWYAVTTW